MIIDNHVHVGWYTDGYHSPKEVWITLQEAGVEEIVVSSTSTCAELYKLVVKEMLELTILGGPHVHPLLWLTPRMMKTWGIRYMLHTKIKWQGIKMHWEAHREWYYNRKLTLQALEIARKLKVPVLLHTGNFKECHAGVFKPLCMENPDMTFVLAHGRPIDEALDVLKSCSNSMIDTAFMPPQEVLQIAECGFSNRLLFGTDTPINLLFHVKMTSTAYIKSCIVSLQEVLPQSIYNKIMSNKVYC